MKFEFFEHFQSVAAYHLLVSPADNDYIIARICLLNNMHREFYWNCLQSIEKYCKAIILLNGYSIKEYGHDISILFEKASCVSGNLMIDGFDDIEIHGECIFFSDTKTFVDRVHNLGHPDTRYAQKSWSYIVNDIFMLDKLVFCLRRLTIGLDWIVGKLF